MISFSNEHQDTESLRIHWSYHLYSESDIYSTDAVNTPCIYIMSNNYHRMLSSYPLPSTKGRDGDGCFSCMLALCKRGRQQKTVWILNNLSWVPWGRRQIPAGAGNGNKSWCSQQALWYGPAYSHAQGNWEPRLLWRFQVPNLRSSVILARPLTKTETKNSQN